MGEYLAAPALLDEPAVQQSFLSYFNTIAVSRETEHVILVLEMHPPASGQGSCPWGGAIDSVSGLGKLRVLV